MKKKMIFSFFENEEIEPSKENDEEIEPSKENETSESTKPVAKPKEVR
jgi:hypothetical protein